MPDLMETRSNLDDEFLITKNERIEVEEARQRNQEHMERENRIQTQPLSSKVKPADVKYRYIDLMKDKKESDATELLVQFIERNNFIYTTADEKISEMWIFKDGIYIPEGRFIIKEKLRELLGKFFNIFVASKVIAKIEADTGIDKNEFFNTNYINEVPVKNGILNISTKTLSPFDPKKIFFNALPVTYDPKATCPQIDSFLTGVLKHPDDKLKLYEVGGSCLRKEYTFEKAVIMTGSGRNGKDKTLELIKRTFGMNNCCAITLHQLETDKFAEGEFLNKMVNISGEISSEGLKNTNKFKGLTGRSLITASRKFLKGINFINYAKFIFACNELPMIYDNTKGFWGRWEVFEFPYTFVTQSELDNTLDKTNLKLRDEQIIDKITTEQEMSGLLNEFLKGLDRLMKNRDFTSTKGSDEIKNWWQRKSNSVMAFCEENITEEYDQTIIKKEFRSKYNQFCNDYKLNKLSDKVIRETLSKTFGAGEDRQEVMGSWSNLWSGIRWKDKIRSNNISIKQELSGLLAFPDTIETSSPSLEVEKP